MQFNDAFSALYYFERFIRPFLGHRNVLTGEDISALQAMADTTLPGSVLQERLLSRYAEMLEAAKTRNHHAMDDGGLPEVATRQGRVSHYTRFAEASFVLEFHCGAHAELHMTAGPSWAVDPEDGFRVALAVIGGYLAGCDAEAEAPEGAIDPRIAARQYLAYHFDDKVVEFMIDHYIPDWESWQAEREIAKAEQRLRWLRDRRHGLAARNRVIHGSHIWP